MHGELLFRSSAFAACVPVGAPRGLMQSAAATIGVMLHRSRDQRCARATQSQCLALSVFCDRRSRNLAVVGASPLRQKPLQV
jgi:hypothetical protein